ncbi:MAG: hypothetical protein R2752_01920 [Vicinamibacterales bacterium]
MFIGHYAVGFGAKRVAPAVSLGTLFLACQLADLIWPTLVLAGVEVVQIDPGNTVVTPLRFVSYPWSHSLLALAVWGAALAGLYRLLRPAAASTTVLVTLAGVVLSHWVLDVASHGPDMPVTPWDATRLGLGLWNSLPATAAVEGGMFAAGVWIYARATAARDRTGRVAFWSLVAFLSLVYVANLLGPPPPSASAVAWSAEALWLVVAWGYWIDRHRQPAA